MAEFRSNHDDAMAEESNDAEFVTVAKVGAIPEGEGASFQVGKRLVAVFNHQGKYLAIDDLCPHMGASLGAGYLDEEGVVTCPWHAWRFNACNGKWADNPRLVGRHVRGPRRGRRDSGAGVPKRRAERCAKRVADHRLRRSASS